MNLVVGATGLLGGEICRRLRQRGLPVRALVRLSSDPEKVAQLRKLGAEVVTGDLQDPGSLERACMDVTGVISTASTTLSRQAHDSLAKTDMVGQINLIEAARKANVRRFVFISFSGNFEGDSPLHVAKRTAEKRLRESGLSYTILRPSCFMEVWLSPALGFDAANRKAQIFGTGEKPLSFISLYDVAEFAVETLTSNAAANQTIELGGPEAVAPREVVKIFEQEVGGPIEVTEVSEDVLRQQYTQATEEYQKTFAGLMLGVCAGDRIDMRETLKKFPVKLTSVRDFARNTATPRS
jgi:uncharacterized protein YbjT (DUF2867 family)